MHYWPTVNSEYEGHGSLSPVRVLICEDHAVLREGLRSLLESRPGFEVVGEAAEGSAALLLAERIQPDLMLLEATLPGRSGMDVLRALAPLKICARPLLLTEDVSSRAIMDALKLGAYGVILKGAGPQQFFRCIRCIMAGQYWIGRKGVSDLVRALQSLELSLEDATRTKGLNLTAREREVVSMIVAGHSNPEIASICSISEQTVKHHVGNVFSKLGVSSRLELAMYALNHRLIA
jgi:two-component system nitrate/nitrite response regulator NarL